MACRTPDQIQNEPVDPSEVHGKRLAMIAWSKKPDGSDDVVVFRGVASWDGKTLAMRRDDGVTFRIPHDWLPRLKRVTPPLREILGESEFHFSVTVGNIDPDDPKHFVKTTLRRPSEDD